jgi:hypoxanthine phosphoribosyltransferase
MNTIQIKDKTFVVSIPESEILKRVKHVAEQINNELAGEDPLFVAILNGAFVFAADLMREVHIPSEISFVKVSSYQGTSSTGQMRELIGLNENVEGRSIVIVEDIVDSGYTMTSILAYLARFKPGKVRICSLLVKPENLKADIHVDYCALRIPNDFIVGYGLDYDGYGRNLRDIYTVVE